MRAGRARRVTAFAPGRVNLIGEHTDYNGGLALPFAIERGVRVEAEANSRDEVVVVSRGFGTDRFSARTPLRASGWRAFARGVVSELGGVPGCRLTVTADLPPAGGLSSSAALTIALALASQGLRGGSSLGTLDLARLCSRVENDWAGTPSGLLDQLAILSGGAVMIEFASLRLEPVSLELDDWTLAVLDSGAPRELAASGYATRRDECAEACRLLRIASLSDATHGDLAHLPAHLARRVRHVLGENDRVRAAHAALNASEPQRLGFLLDASHASLRDLYECSTPEVENAVERLKSDGALGARMIGGGFGGHVLGLFAPGVDPPDGALVVRPGPRAMLRAS